MLMKSIHRNSRVLDLVSALCKCIGREKPSVNRTGSLPVAHRQSFCQKELPEWSGAQLGSVPSIVLTRKYADRCSFFKRWCSPSALCSIHIPSLSIFTLLLWLSTGPTTVQLMAKPFFIKLVIGCPQVHWSPLAGSNCEKAASPPALHLLWSNRNSFWNSDRVFNWNRSNCCQRCGTVAACKLFLSSLLDLFNTLKRLKLTSCLPLVH